MPVSMVRVAVVAVAAVWVGAVVQSIGIALFSEWAWAVGFTIQRLRIQSKKASLTLATGSFTADDLKFRALSPDLFLFRRRLRFLPQRPFEALGRVNVGAHDTIVETRLPLFPSLLIWTLAIGACWGATAGSGVSLLWSLPLVALVVYMLGMAMYAEAGRTGQAVADLFTSDDSAS